MLSYINEWNLICLSHEWSFLIKSNLMGWRSTNFYGVKFGWIC